MNIKFVLYKPVTFLIFDFLLRNKVPVRLRLDNKANLANEMKTRAYFLLAVLVMVIPLDSRAEVSTGLVTKMEYGPVYRGLVFVDIEGETNTECATNRNGFDYAFDASTEAGKLVFSSLLAAQRSGVEVTLSGEGTCTLNTTIEDLRWMQSK
ncbi:hypothetical protein D1216_09100 [Vibrio parahaemolyticus]|nr:hypothetical protein [Vibrio parahaemolyticus]HAS6856252.1 hypothetical protein [Vibrio parahaemolyticus]